MSQKPTYYQLLEVDLSADADAIKAAYRRLARKYHPDMNPGDSQAETRFKQIGEAYNTLSDPQKRGTYNATMGISPKTTPPAPSRSSQNATPQSATPSPQPNSRPGQRSANSKVPPRSKSAAPSPSAGANANINGTQFKEMFDALFGHEPKAAPKKPNPTPNAQSTARQTQSARQAESPPKTPPRPQAAPQPQAKRGEDITVDVLIKRDEAQAGTTKTVNVQHTEFCKRCSGTGRVNGAICPICHGEKNMITVRKIDVRIPTGVKGGSKVRVAKEGGRGMNGGEPGDLFMLIKIEEELALKIDGVNVTGEVSISITDAVLGTELDVQTIHGKVKMAIPPLTSSGKVFRLKGQGILLNGVTGDQFVTVQIVSPKTLSPKEKALYEELAHLQNEATH